MMYKSNGHPISEPKCYFDRVINTLNWIKENKK